MSDENTVTLTGKIAGAPVLRIGADGEARIQLRVGVRTTYVTEGKECVHPSWFVIDLRGPRAEELLHEVRVGVRVRVTGALQSFPRRDLRGTRYSGISISADQIDVLEPAENKSSVS